MKASADKLDICVTVVSCALDKLIPAALKQPCRTTRAWRKSGDYQMLNYLGHKQACQETQRISGNSANCGTRQLSRFINSICRDRKDIPYGVCDEHARAGYWQMQKHSVLFKVSYYCEGVTLILIQESMIVPCYL